jgi:hypothetical protein
MVSFGFHEHVAIAMGTNARHLWAIPDLVPPWHFAFGETDVDSAVLHALLGSTLRSWQALRTS